MASRPLRAMSSVDSQPAEKLGRDHLVGLVVLGQKRPHAIELALERPVEPTPRNVNAGALRLDDRVEQRGGGHRLAKEHVDAELGTARLLFLPGVGADDDDRQRASLAATPDASGSFEAVHARQHPVENDEPERIRTVLRGSAPRAAPGPPPRSRQRSTGIDQLSSSVSSSSRLVGESSTISAGLSVSVLGSGAGGRRPAARRSRNGR